MSCFSLRTLSSSEMRDSLTPVREHVLDVGLQSFFVLHKRSHYFWVLLGFLRDEREHSQSLELDSLLLVTQRLHYVLSVLDLRQETQQKQLVFWSREQPIQHLE